LLIIDGESFGKERKKRKKPAAASVLQHSFSSQCSLSSFFLYTDANI
jgi:hypothetical protein